jgi:hypothetical protein
VSVKEDDDRDDWKAGQGQVTHGFKCQTQTLANGTPKRPQDDQAALGIVDWRMETGDASGAALERV